MEAVGALFSFYSRFFLHVRLLLLLLLVRLLLLLGMFI